MMKKKIAAILTCAMVLAGIAGCGNSAGGEQSDVPLESKTEDEQKTETENKESADSGETAAASEASDGGELSGTLVFWSGGDLSNETDLTTKWIKETVDMFAEMHPNLKVEQTYVPGGDYLTKITTEIAADNAPDVFQTWLSGRLEPFVTAGQVMPIEHMLESYPGTAAIMNEKGLNLGTFDGKKYAIPLVASGEMVFYNKKIFEENGISVPQTYDELLEIVDTLKGKEITPCNLGISDPWPGTIPYMMIFNRLNGNDLYESVVLNKEADFANEGFVNAGNKLQELVNSGMFIETIAAISQEEAQQKFMAGDSAMIIDGSWAAPNYIAALGDDVGVFNFPEIEGGKGSADDWLMNFDNAYAISSKTQNVEAAEALLAFMFSEERQAAYAETGAIIACRNVNYDKSKVPALTRDISEAFESAAYSIIPWDNPLGTDVGAELNNTTRAVITGEDPQEAFEALQDYALDAWE